MGSWFLLKFTLEFYSRHPTTSKDGLIGPFQTSCYCRAELRGCLHDTGATFAPRRVHSGSLSWLYICLHTTTKCHAGASRPGVSSLRLSHRGEISLRCEISQRCHVETTTRFGMKSFSSPEPLGLICNRTT